MTEHLLSGLDHLQIEAPAGHEAAALAFYGGLLGLTELEKPEVLRPNGGVWLLLPDGVQLHTGAVGQFSPRAVGRPGFRCPDLGALLGLPGAARIAAGRMQLTDPFGNRLEVLELGARPSYPELMDNPDPANRTGGRNCTDNQRPLISGLDHLQIEAPAGHEAAARHFYGEVLGLPELERPQGIAHIPGLWFGLPDGRQVHTGVADDFVPRDKGHPCFAAPDLNRVLARAAEYGVPNEEDFRLAPLRRAFLRDPFGNRVEVVEGGHVSVHRR